MLIFKLLLTGHVHDRPDDIITHSYSWPHGKTDDVVDHVIDAFAKAFTIISIQTDPPSKHDK